MNYFEDARELIAHSREKLGQIRVAYEQSLHERTVRSDLRIEIKNFMENLRSALDYSAHGLFSRYGSSQRKKPRIYFPYAQETQDLEAFEASNAIEARIPGLRANKPEAVEKLLAFQHFSGPEWAWLPKFMELNNESKHQQLTPQTKKEYRELRLSSGGASIDFGPGASISMDPGTYIQIGDMLIPGGQSISPEQPAYAIGGKQEVITWVSFRFSLNEEEVLDFLKRALKGVDQIVEELSTV